MAYSDFTIDNVGTKLNLAVQDASFLPEIAASIPSEWLSQSLENGRKLAIDSGTEKARSEFIIAPILLEVRNLCDRQVSIFSGQDFTVDKELGLSGACDFLITRGSFQLSVKTPVIALVEAKKGIIKDGLGQCIAEMSAAQRFNEQQGNPVEIIYGVVTTGDLWRFLQLQDQTVLIDSDEYSLNPVDRLLGILSWMLRLPTKNSGTVEDEN